MMSVLNYVVIAYAISNNVVRSEGSADPCLSGVYRNISHLGERYVNIDGDCHNTDNRIERAWFYAGVDPIVTYPPNRCKCGFKFPIWMNGTLPSSDDGIVDRNACLHFIDTCSKIIKMQVKNCGTFFVYYLKNGPDNAGFCFGIDKPEPSHNTGGNKNDLLNATIAIQKSRITQYSFITDINTTISDDSDVNITAELVLSNGTTVRSLSIDKPLRTIEWDHLTPSTNYTVQICMYSNAEKHVLASEWTVTKAIYRAPTVSIKIQQTITPNLGINVRINFDSGSDNETAYGRLVVQNNSHVTLFDVDKPTVLKSFNDLESGTKYIVEVCTNQTGVLIDLGRKWIITQPKMEVNLKSSEEFSKSYPTFECKFHPMQDISYSVRWIVQRTEKNYTIEKTANNSDDVQSLSLTEEDLVKRHLFLPFHISCAVAEIQNTRRTSFSISSEKFFAGIKILTPRITMHRDETTIISFYPTIPIGCSSLQTKTADGCNLTLAITIPVSNNCTGISTRRCTVTMPGKAGNNGSFQIQATEDGQYGIQKDSTHKVILRTAHLSNDTIWSDYALPAIAVVVKPEIDTYWRGKECEALNDPHMFTFDRRAYEHHESISDEYILYIHESFNAKIHHKLERCNSIAMCNCGVAVQAGRDLYMISTCNNILEIGYKQCDDGVLLVKQESDSLYTIYLPYGTYVKARIDKSPYSGVSMIVSVSVFPSVHDQNGRSKGLCGTLDNIQANDFHDISGKTSLNRKEFIQAWKVQENDCLFVATPKSSQPWMHPACACAVSNGHVTTEDNCQLGADNTCTKGKTVGQQVCRFAEKMPINTFNGLSVPALNLTEETNHVGQATTTTTLPTKNWNSAEANSFCTAFLNKSRTFRLCKRVPYTNTGRAIETCAQDIIITQTTDWHKLSRQSMQDACLSEIHRNKTVREHLDTPKKTTSTLNPPTPNSGQHIGQVTLPKPTEMPIDFNLDINQLVEEIEKNTCPNECSENGLCNNGTCKCNVGFGRDDCSMDLTKPPSATNFLHGNVCDEKEAPCTHVYIHGGFFARETVSCHITTYETHAGKEGQQNSDAYVIRGQTQSLIEVICPLTSPTRRRRSIPDTKDAKLLSCYKVTVSNDGIHHGSPITMCVYNSQCHILFNGSDGLLTANIKKGFCYIEGKCVPANVRKSSSETYCLPAISLYSWSDFPTTTVETHSSRTTSAVGVVIIDNTENNWHTPVIIAVACICCLFLIVGIVFLIRKKKQRKTEDNKKGNNEFEFSKKYDADFDEETYAHINPTDVSDNVSHGNKTGQSRNATDEYYRLDISNKDKVQYSMLNSTQNIRSRGGPSLPERDVTNHGDPYEKLRAQTREQRLYDRMGNFPRNVEEIGEPIDLIKNRSSEKVHSYIILQDTQDNYLTPREGFDEVSLEGKRNESEQHQRNDDLLEGYERPGQQYRRY